MSKSNGTPLSDRLNGAPPPTPPAAPTGGRDRKGRFAAGNKLGVGRPPRPVELHYLRAISNRCPPELFAKAVDAVVRRAVDGDLASLDWLCRRLLGPKSMSLTELAAADFFDDDLKVIQDFEQMRHKQSCRTYANARTRRQMDGSEPVEEPRI